MIRKWANSKLDSLSCENVQLHIKNYILPEVYKTYLGDCDSDDDALSQDDLLHLFGLKKICLTTVWKWMKYMGFSYNERIKSYFSDHHEDEGNKTCQKKFIKEYFEIEKRTYRWIQLTEEVAKNMKKKKTCHCLEIHIMNMKRMI